MKNKEKDQQGEQLPHYLKNFILENVYKAHKCNKSYYRIAKVHCI